MKTSEKIKAQKALDRIQSGSFDELDVDSLLMGLRPYSGRYHLFREAADFVAHNDKRDKGLTNQSLEALYLSMKYFVEFVSPKKPLDISEPFPRYIKKLMKYQVDKCSAEELRQRFKVTPARLKSRIDTLFKDDPKSKTSLLRKSGLSNDTFLAIQHLLGFIGSHPAFTGTDVLNELVAVANMNGLGADEIAIREQQDILLLCLMLLMHKTKFNFGGVEDGECMISSATPSIPLGVVVGIKPPPVLISPSFGLLQVNGKVKVETAAGLVTVAYPVFTTPLLASDKCDASLFVVEEPLKEHPGFYLSTIAFDQPLTLTTARKLGVANV